MITDRSDIPGISSCYLELGLVEVPQKDKENDENIGNIANRSFDLLECQRLRANRRAKLKEELSSIEKWRKESQDEESEINERYEKSNQRIDAISDRLDAMGKKGNEIQEDLHSLNQETDRISDEMEEEGQVLKISENEIEKLSQRTGDLEGSLKEHRQGLSAASSNLDAIESNLTEIRDSHQRIQNEQDLHREEISGLESFNSEAKGRIEDINSQVDQLDKREGILDTANQIGLTLIGSGKMVLEKCNYENLYYVASNISSISLDVFSYLGGCLSATCKAVCAYAWSTAIRSIPIQVWVIIGAIAICKANKVLSPKQVLVALSALFIYEYFLKNSKVFKEFRDSEVVSQCKDTLLRYLGCS